MNHHDLFFKKTFSIRENATDFVRLTLPPGLVEQMDFETLSIEKGSHVDTLVYAAVIPKGSGFPGLLFHKLLT
jgi:predicted transposase YdaD